MTQASAGISPIFNINFTSDAIANAALMDSNCWPVLEAKKILEKIGHKTPKKGYVLFETGYGPSGLPHIGTFGEVVKTSFVRKAFTLLRPDIPTKMIVMSDDADGMRKVPDNLPNIEMLKKHLHKPLRSVPDPFEEEESYGDNMNKRLRAFLDNFDFDYEFASATDYYKRGVFNEYLTKCAEKYEELMAIMIPTLGEERQKTYSPFMPIDEESGIVVADGVISVDPKACTIKYTAPSGKIVESSFLNGGCKLQWKCDFGMRWAALDVDYEIYGKDHYPNEPVYRAICETLGKTPPVNFFYELFLDIEGKKISKSKGNGISIDEWLKYSTTESLEYYMFLKPKTAKKLYFEVIPKATDEYISFADKLFAGFKYLQDCETGVAEANIADGEVDQEDERRKVIDKILTNPVFWLHEQDAAYRKNDISFQLMLNLVSACSPDEEDVLWGFIERFNPELNKGTASNMLKKMVRGAMFYYEDYVKANKKFRSPTELETKALNVFAEKLKTYKPTTENVEEKAVELQNLAYQSAHDCEMDTKLFFNAIYQVLLGAESGPRVGPFVALYGVNNVINLISSKLS